MKFTKLLSLLLEGPNKITRKILSDSDPARKERADNVKVLSLNKFTPSTTKKEEPLLKGWSRYEFEVISKEKVENRTHTGYIVLNGHKSVKDVYCSCADFQFLWRYALTKGDIASWEVYPKYKDIETHGPHNKEPSDITNPNYNKRLCKHLIKIFNVLNLNE